MPRAKMICTGRTKDGLPCRNWALRGSPYCAAHQSQQTEGDRQTMATAQGWTAALIIIALVVAFLVSTMAGCEEGFLKWLTG